ncbi:MAG TPA: tetratricopeptide repeat protein [Bacteroidales bacterium]|nr:tetratricopeptide repeat protein [Bacteroidales bacterium]
MKKIIILTFCVLGYTLLQAQVFTKQKAKNVLQKAEDAYNKGSYKSALEYYEEANTYYPKHFDAEAYYKMGISYAKLSNDTQAISCFQKTIAINPNYVETYLYMGTSYAKLGNYNQAISYYQKATTVNPNDAKAYYNMGGAYYKLGNDNQAISCLQKAIAINPNFAEAYYAMGLSYAELGNDNQAISYYKKAARLGHKDAQEFLKSNGYTW